MEETSKELNIEETTEKKGETQTTGSIVALQEENLHMQDNEDLFITEKSTFDAKVRFYRNVGGELVVEGVSPDFDEKDEKNQLQEFTVTCKYPSQSDYQNILNSPSFKSLSDLTAIDIILLELNRLSLLIRKWTLKQDLSRVMEMDPRIVKGILWAVSQKIGMQGIF